MGMEDTWCRENNFSGQETHSVGNGKQRIEGGHAKTAFHACRYGRTLENNPCGWEAIPKSALDIFNEPTGCCDVVGDDNPSHSLKLSLDR